MFRASRLLGGAGIWAAIGVIQVLGGGESPEAYVESSAAYLFGGVIASYVLECGMMAFGKAPTAGIARGVFMATKAVAGMTLGWMVDQGLPHVTRRKTWEAEEMRKREKRLRPASSGVTGPIYAMGDAMTAPTQEEVGRE